MSFFNCHKRERTYTNSTDTNTETDTNKLSDKSDIASAPDSPKRKKSSENAEIIEKIVSYLNQKTGKNFKANTKETKNLITARLKEKFTVEDFFTVIDIKCADWLNNPEMCKYLRPKTLFGPKFESYLNQNAQQRSDNCESSPIYRSPDPSDEPF